MENLFNEFKKWIKTHPTVCCTIMNNNQTIAQVMGKIEMGDELNGSEYPDEMKIHGDLTTVEIGEWYINNIHKYAENTWCIVVDAHHNYVIG